MLELLHYGTVHLGTSTQGICAMVRFSLRAASESLVQCNGVLLFARRANKTGHTSNTFDDTSGCIVNGRRRTTSAAGDIVRDATQNVFNSTAVRRQDELIYSHHEDDQDRMLLHALCIAIRLA